MNNYFVYHVIHLTRYESSFLWFTSLALLLGVRSLATVCQINVTQQMISTLLDQPSNDPNLKKIYIHHTTEIFCDTEKLQKCPNCSRTAENFCGMVNTVW